LQKRGRYFVPQNVSRRGGGDSRIKKSACKAGSELEGEELPVKESQTLKVNCFGLLYGEVTLSKNEENGMCHRQSGRGRAGVMLLSTRVTNIAIGHL